MTTQSISGIFGAALTPMKADFSADLEAVPIYLSFLAERGCHGALLLGTTGEGPSFSMDERQQIFKAALEVRQEHPDFYLLAGTGSPSLTEAIMLTKNAFDIGFDGVVTLPPYYYHQASLDGLYTWFREIIIHAVPEDGALLGYHIPAQSGVPLPLDLLLHLKDSFPDQFAGIKDSSADPKHSEILGERFGRDLTVLVGSDALLTHALENQGSGCITALANLYSPELRVIWDAFQQDKRAPDTQARLTGIRNILSNYTPYPATLKALIAHYYDFPHWKVRPPLMPMPVEMTCKVLQELEVLA